MRRSLGTQDRHLDLATADHAETGGGIEDRSTVLQGNGLFTGIDQVCILLPFIREGTHTENPVLTLEDDVDPFGEIVGHQGGNTDAQVDVVAVLQF